MNDRKEMNAQDRPRRPKRSLLLSLLFILFLLMSLCCMLLFARLTLSEEKQEWLKASMATKLRADYREWVEMRRFAPLRPEVIDETAKDESALAAVPGTGLVPVAVAIASSGGLPFPSPSPTSFPVPTPQPSPTFQPSPTAQPSPTSTGTAAPTPTTSPTAAPTATALSPTATPVSPTPTSPLPTPTLPPPPTPTLPPPPTPTSPPPSPPTPTSPPPPPPTPTSSPLPTSTSPPPHTPTSTPTSPPPPAPIVYSISPDNGATKSSVSITNLAGENFQPGATARIDNGISSIDLISVAVVNANQIIATLDLSVAAGGPWNVQVTNPDFQSGIASNAFTVTIPIIYSYPTITPTCNISVTYCLSGTGAPDGNTVEVAPNGVITLDFGAGNGIMDGQGYDFVFFEFPFGSGILLDWVVVDISDTGINWHQVFNWGDNITDTNANVASYNYNGDTGEQDNENIQSNDLWPSGLTTNTGIAIDIDTPTWDPTPGSQYRYVRFSCPSGGGDAAQIDSIERLH